MVMSLFKHMRVATVLTVYGIETLNEGLLQEYRVLQQYLPFTVLKRCN